MVVKLSVVICLCFQWWDSKGWGFACERRLDQVEKVHLCCPGDCLLMNLILCYSVSF